MDTVFIGYAENSSAYRFLVTNSEVSEISNNTILESRDATFFEHIFPYKTCIPSQVSESSLASSLPSMQDKEVEPQGEIRRSKE